MTKRTALVALLATGLAAGAAHAQAPSTLDIAGHPPGPAAGGVVGGGGATLVGGGDDMTIVYARGGAGGGGALLAQAPRLARMRNGFGSPGVEYLEPETAPPGREAWLTGGGGDAQVTYGRPR
jgi:hypothetical protein